MATLRKRNDKWQAQVRRTGHAPRTNTFLNRADAQRWIRQTELELDRTPLGFDPSVLENTKIDDLLDRYASEVTPHKRGRECEALRIAAFRRERWASLPLARANAQLFKSYRDQRMRTVSAGTVIRELGLLHAVFETARREWDMPLSENPLARVRKPRAPEGRERRLLSGELESLLSAASAARCGWLKPAILLAVETGMRRGEILNIRKRDVKLKERLLAIPETKTGIPRTIPLTDAAVVILRPLHEAAEKSADRLFQASANAFRLSWERCKRRAATETPDIKDLRFHDLRHEAVSRFFELGLGVPEVAVISGHELPPPQIGQ